MLKEKVKDSVDFFAGQMSGAPLKTLKPQESSQIKNFHVLQNSLKKINGGSLYAQLETINPSEGIVWLEYFQGRVFAQKGSTVWTETGTTGSGVFTSSSLGSTNRVFSTTYKRALFLANGRYLKYLDTQSATPGTPVDWGLLPPIGVLDNSHVTSSNAAGLLNNGGVYKWALTLYDASTNVESPAVNSRPGEDGLFGLNPGGASAYDPDCWSISLGGSDDTVTFTFAEISALIQGAYVSSRATHFRMYRTEDGGSVFKLCSSMSYGAHTVTDGTIPISTFISTASTLLDLGADTSLGSILEDELMPPPSVDRMVEMQSTIVGITIPASSFSTYKHVRNFRDSIFAIGSSVIGIGGNAGADSFSSTDSTLYIHDPFNPDYLLDTRHLDDGDEGGLGKAVAVLRDSTLLAFKERSTYYLLGTSVDNYQIRVMDGKRGCAHPGTIQETPEGVFSLDYSGLVLFSGIGNGDDLSDPAIADVIARINWNAIDTCYSAYDGYEKTYILSIPVDGSGYPNLTICYNLDSKAFSYEEGVEGRSRKYSTNYGNKSKISFQGSRTNGLILNISSETATTLLSNPITAQWTSAPLYFGDPNRKKKARFIYITAESSQDFTVDIDIIPDFGQSQFYSLTDINSSTVYSVYAASLLDSGANVGVFDSSQWSEAKTTKQIKVPVFGVGYCFQVRITNRESDPNKYGFRIISVEVEAVMLGK